MEEFDWDCDRRVLRGPFSFFDGTMIFESLDVDPTEATALLRITYKGNDPLLKKGRGHPLVPPLHLHFKQSETFKVIQGKMAAVVGYEEKEVFISSTDKTPYEIPPWTPHTPYCYGGDEDTIAMVRAHPAADDDPLGALFFEHLFMHLDEAHRAKKAPDLVQVLVMQQATDSALIMFPSAWYLGSLRWQIPWLIQASIAKVATALFGYTPVIKKFMKQE